MTRIVIVLAVLGLAGAGMFAIQTPRAGDGPLSPPRSLSNPLAVPDDGGFGVKPASEARQDDPIYLGEIEPFAVFDEARFAVNSVAMRDCRMGAINLVGPPPGSQVIKAYLYWQWACLEEPATGIHDVIRFKQVYPNKVGGYQVGMLVGVAPNPCWCPPEFRAWTFRADVTPVMSPTGGGSYGVILHPASAGSYTYTDPWPSVAGCPTALPPLFEGVALVVVYKSECEPNGIVCLYDAPLPNTMFTASPGVFYNLLHPPVPSQLTEARWAQASCDGQTGFGYTDGANLATTNTFLNGGLIAGPGSMYNDSDFNGAAGKPLPQLYDTSGHEVTWYMEPGAPFTNIMILEPTGFGPDCIIIDLNVLFFR